MNIMLEVARLENNNDVISTSCNRETHYALIKIDIEGGFVVKLPYKIVMASPDYKYTKEISPVIDDLEGPSDEITKFTNWTISIPPFTGKITNLYYFENGHYHLCDGEHYVEAKK